MKQSWINMFFVGKIKKFNIGEIGDVPEQSFTVLEKRGDDNSRVNV